MLDLSNNNLTAVPAQLGNLTALQARAGTRPHFGST
jgi:hypothetical protein